MFRKYSSFFILHFSFLIVAAQQTQAFLDREIAFKKGIELFDEKNYLLAREKFEEIYKQLSAITSNKNEVLFQNLEYYIAVCAFEAGDKDAEQLLLNYIKNYHETDKRRLVYFWLGKYYYRDNKFTDAITWFSKVKTDDLSSEQLYEYKFQLAYSYFTKKKFKEAKPLFAAIKDKKEKYFYPATYYYAFICFYEKNYDDALKSFSQIEDSKMYASVIPYYIAQIYFYKKDYDNTVSYINKSLLKNNVSYKNEMKFLLGQVYFQKNEYARALPLLEEYISKNSKASKEDIYRLAYCQYQTGAYEKAIENFKQLNLLHEKIGQNATYALGDCYLKTNQKDKARSAFQSAASMNYDETVSQDALFNYGKLSFELGFSTDAIQSFENYINKYPNGTYVNEANELLAAVLVQTKNYERAYKIMEGLKTESALIKEAYQKVTYFRAIELFNDAKDDEAFALCEKSLKNPVNIELQALAIYLRAEILYNKGRYDEAAREYARFAQYATPALDKKGEASKFRADYNIGYCYFKQKNYRDAAIYFGSAIENSETTSDKKGKTSLLPDLYLRYADCSFVTKNYGKAVTAYSKISDMKWRNAEYAQYQKAVILGLQNKDDEKISALNQLVSRFPNSNYVAQVNYEIGETYLQKNNLSAARIAYQKVISENPNSALLPKCYMKLAVIDYNTGKKELAAEDYKTVVRKFPDSKEAAQSLDALKDIYVELGKPDDYFTFAKGNSNVVIRSSEEDSLTFQSAENAYNANDCAHAVSLYGNYVSKFPNGLFASEAHWKKSECHIKAKEFSNALSSYEAIIQSKESKYFEKALLRASGIAYYELKDFAKANSFYKQLYVVSSSSQNTYTAMLGMLNCVVQLNNTDEIIEYADQFVNSGTATGTDLQNALYQKGKAFYAKGNKDFALGAFNRVTEMPVSEKAVEAKYMVAKILHEQQHYKSSLDTCFRLRDKYSSYEFWVAKTFILVADNYYALGNIFQAKATLESIVENYDGDKNVLDEAKTKLEKIRTEELNKSKIMQTVPTDTLQMETDSLINNQQDE